MDRPHEDFDDPNIFKLSPKEKKFLFGLKLFGILVISVLFTLLIRG